MEWKSFPRMRFCCEFRWDSCANSFIFSELSLSVLWYFIFHFLFIQMQSRFHCVSCCAPNSEKLLRSLICAFDLLHSSGSNGRKIYILLNSHRANIDFKAFIEVWENTLPNSVHEKANNLPRVGVRCKTCLCDVSNGFHLRMFSSIGNSPYLRKRARRNLYPEVIIHHPRSEFSHKLARNAN